MVLSASQLATIFLLAFGASSVVAAPVTLLNPGDLVTSDGKPVYKLEPVFPSKRASQDFVLSVCFSQCCKKLRGISRIKSRRLSAGYRDDNGVPCPFAGTTIYDDVAMLSSRMHSQMYGHHFGPILRISACKLSVER